MKSPIETEVKIRIGNLSEVIARLREAGFRESAARVFEANTLYDTEDGTLRGRGMLLRLREAGGGQVITWKGPGEPGPYKSRPELETSVGSVETLGKIFGQVGYGSAFRYEKYRTEFVDGGQDQAGTVTVDETPIGNFLELEGPGGWIDETARRLGFSAQDYILESYGRLYSADCERRGVEPTDMVFTSNG